MRVVITGSTGFIGSNLKSHFLKKGIRSTCLDRGAGKADSITWENVSKISTLSADAIIHLAGKAHDTSGSSFPDEYFTVNTKLTEQLFDQFLSSPVRDFIYFSSVKAAADSVDGILDENQIPDPRTPYGRSKLKAEEYILSHDLPVQKRVIILRPSMVHGPGNKGNLNLLFNVVQKGIPWPLATFENRRSFLSIDNLCYIVTAIMNSKDVPSGIYNCADDESLATNELVSLISVSLGKKPKLWHIPKQIINGTALIGNILHLPLNAERLKKLTDSYVVSNEKLKMVLGIKEMPVPARDGLLNTFKSFST